MCCVLADDNCLLFVKNLPEDVTKEMLEEVFDNAKDVRLPLNAEGNFRGYGLRHTFCPSKFCSLVTCMQL